MEARQNRRTRLFIVATAVAIAIVTLMLLLWLACPISPPDTGIDLLTKDPSPEEMRAVQTALMESATELIQLAAATFGAVAFLVTYNRERGGLLPARSWLLLTPGLVFLLGAILSGLIIREHLLISFAWEALDLRHQALIYGRWSFYVCYMTALVFVGGFALDVALAPREQGRDDEAKT